MKIDSYMKGNSFRILVFFLIVWCGITSIYGLEMRVGTGMGTQIHYSKNTFRFAPGIALHFALQFHPYFDFDLRLLMGALMGNSIRIEPGIIYNFLFGRYIPGIGLHGSIDFGSVVFHAQSSQDIIQPSYPELGLYITLRPAYFRFSRVDLSFIDISVGTDMLDPGRILLLSIELIHIDYRI